jgi:hypothetical protein
LASASIHFPAFAPVSWARRHRSRAVTSVIVAAAVIVGGTIGGTALANQLAYSNAQTAFTNALPSLPVAAALDYAAHQRFDTARSMTKELAAGATAIAAVAGKDVPADALRQLARATSAATPLLAAKPGKSVSVTAVAPESTTAGYRAGLASFNKLVTAAQSQTARTERATTRLRAGSTALSVGILDAARSLTISNSPAGTSLGDAATQLSAALTTIQPDGPKGSVRTDFITAAQAKHLVALLDNYLAALRTAR